MGRFLAKRLLQGVVAVFLLMIAIFILARLTGDPTHLLVSDWATAEEVARVRAQLGLDKSYAEQFYIFVRGVFLYGDFGTSIFLGRPTLQIVLDRLPNTLRLVVPAILLATVCAIPLGVIAATKRGTVFDRLATGIAAVGMSAPAFWIGIVLMLVFAVMLGLLPAARMGGPSHYVLPVVTITVSMIAAQMRLLRSSMLEVMDSDYIKLARIKGISESKVIWWHALRNSIITLFTYAAMQLTILMTGSIVVETVFAWPGVGRLTYQAIMWRDYPLLQTIIILKGIIIVSLNILVDIGYAYLDPRIRYGQR